MISLTIKNSCNIVKNFQIPYNFDTGDMILAYIDREESDWTQSDSSPDWEDIQTYLELNERGSINYPFNRKVLPFIANKPFQYKICARAD